MLKKLLCAISVLSLLTFTACSSTKSDTSETSTTESSQETSEADNENQAEPDVQIFKNILADLYTTQTEGDTTYVSTYPVACYGALITNNEDKPIQTTITAAITDEDGNSIDEISQKLIVAPNSTGIWADSTDLSDYTDTDDIKIKLNTESVYYEDASYLSADDMLKVSGFTYELESESGDSYSKTIDYAYTIENLSDKALQAQSYLVFKAGDEIICAARLTPSDLDAKGKADIVDSYVWGYQVDYTSIELVSEYTIVDVQS
jgi:hypothetical protein